MKKHFLIILVALLLSGNAYTENLGTDKTVNDYVSDGYTIVSVETFDRTALFYTLRSNAKSKPLVVSCMYSPKEEITICFKP